MLYIRCEDTRGNFERFAIPEVNTADELKEYADKNLPIKCYRMDYRYKNSIHISEEFETVFLYLNQFALYKQIYPYIMCEEEFNLLKETQCKNCSLRTKNYGFDCLYKKSEHGCSNFDEEIHIALLEWFKSKFKIQ